MGFEFQQRQGISPRHDVQIGHYPLGSLSGAHSRAVNEQNNEADHSPPQSAKVKVVWSYTSKSSRPTPLDRKAIFPHSYLITCVCEKVFESLLRIVWPKATGGKNHSWSQLRPFRVNFCRKC